MIDIDINEQAGDWPAVESQIQTALLCALKHTDTNAQDVSVVLGDNDFVQQLNKTYRGKDKPTNVLSFPQDVEESLGDIILALETIQNEASEQQKPFDHHLQHLIIHGFLHLLGHDHESDDEAKIMEGLEVEILNDLGIKNPYETEEFMS